MEVMSCWSDGRYDSWGSRGLSWCCTVSLRIRVRSVQQIPDYWNPMREWSISIPRKMDGTGSVTLWMKSGNMRHFGLDKFPRPECNGGTDPKGQCRGRLSQGKIAGPNQGSFRIAYEWVPDKQKPRMASFRLSSNYLIETLEVISHFLDQNYEGSFEIRNRFGNNLDTGQFIKFV